MTRIELNPPGHDDRRLSAQVDDFVEALPAASHRLLEYLAVADPLPLTDAVALAGADAVDDAVRCRGCRRGRRPVAPGASACSSTRYAGRSAARTCAGCAPRWWSGSPRQAPTVSWGDCAGPSLAIGSDRPQPVADACAAAQEALRLGDLELSERLGQAALGREPDLATRLTVGYALAWQGRGREADAVLAEIDPAALTEDELMAWALPTAANQFWMLSEPERATAFLQGHPRQGVLPGGADDAGRVVGDVHDERRKCPSRNGNRR